MSLLSQFLTIILKSISEIHCTPHTTAITTNDVHRAPQISGISVTEVPARPVELGGSKGSDVVNVDSDSPILMKIEEGALNVAINSEHGEDEYEEEEENEGENEEHEDDEHEDEEESSQESESDF